MVSIDNININDLITNQTTKDINKIINELEQERLIYYPKVNDLIIYRESNATFIGEVIYVDLMTDLINVRDLKILDNRSGAELLLFAEWAMSVDNIVKNFGNIEFDEFEENYPEWTI